MNNERAAGSPAAPEGEMSRGEDAEQILRACPQYDADNNPDPWQIDEDLWAACRNVAAGYKELAALLREALANLPAWAGVNDDAHGWWVRVKQAMAADANGGEKYRKGE